MAKRDCSTRARRQAVREFMDQISRPENALALEIAKRRALRQQKRRARYARPAKKNEE